MENLEKFWLERLNDILSELDDGEYKKMLTFLDKIKKDKRKQDKSDIAEEILNVYGLEDSLTAVEIALDKIPRRDQRIRKYLDEMIKRAQFQEPQRKKKAKEDVAEDNIEKDFLYNMSGRREAFILCQKKCRDGAENDLMTIENLLKTYKFVCTSKCDLTAEAIISEVTKFQQSLRSEVACCFVVLMAHGTKGNILGTDNVMVLLKNIFTLFNNENCPNLKGKPKVFIIQACRGDGADFGVPMESDNIDEMYEDDGCITPRMPTVSDTLIVCPTLPGKIALRNPTLGSPLFIEMEKIFNQFADKHHLIDLFTKVNYNLVRTDYPMQKYPNEIVKITLCLDSTFTRQLYL